MEKKLVITADGSHSLYIEEMDESYHSKHGSIAESEHIFIQSGLIKKAESQKVISIFEVGMGTGLNVLKTVLAANENDLTINYEAVEAFPLDLDIIKELNFTEEVESNEAKEIFNQIHKNPWNTEIRINSKFKLRKFDIKLQEFNSYGLYDLIYFDAFGAEHQPELWTVAIFNIMFAAMKKQAVLVTYCAKGSVRRAMQEVGFTVERLEGPPGKREMLRATK